MYDFVCRPPRGERKKVDPFPGVRRERSPAFESGGESNPSRAHPQNNEMLATNSLPLLQSVRKLLEGEREGHKCGFGRSLLTAVYPAKSGLLVLKHRLAKEGVAGGRASSEDARHPWNIWKGAQYASHFKWRHGSP